MTSPNVTVSDGQRRDLEPSRGCRPSAPGDWDRSSDSAPGGGGGADSWEDGSRKPREQLGAENVKEPVLSNHIALNIIRGRGK